MSISPQFAIKYREIKWFRQLFGQMVESRALHGLVAHNREVLTFGASINRESWPYASG